ncbi:MAG: NAD-dependent epimerase/dehydratase family protein [Planctomycetota bacterium]|nr:NAD-dependent epimerase/dehydratase family protein [Planctomycetota bacterium]
MKILVLGGTGFLGPHEIDQFEDRDWEITIFNRGRSKTDLFDSDFAKVTRLTGDRDPDQGDGLAAIEEAIKSGTTWDAVVDNSAYVPRIAKASAELLKDATRQYVFISTISVYAENDTAGADESAPVGTMDDPTDENVGAYYGQLKALCEQEVQRVFDDRATIIRPGLIVGPGDKTDRFTYWPVRCRRGGEVLVPAENPRTQFIDVRDLAGFITTCVEQGHGGVYNATGPEGPLYFREMVDGCKAVVSNPVEFVPVPESFLQANEVGPWMGRTRWRCGFHSFPRWPGSASGPTRPRSSMAARSARSRTPPKPPSIGSLPLIARTRPWVSVRACPPLERKNSSPSGAKKQRATKRRRMRDHEPDSVTSSPVCTRQSWA